MGYLRILLFLYLATYSCSGSLIDKFKRYCDTALKEYEREHYIVKDVKLVMKDVLEMRLMGSRRGEPELKDSFYSILENRTNRTLSKTSLATDLRTSITNTTTIANTKDITADLKVPVPALPFLDKIGLKFSRTDTFQQTFTQDITRKAPSETIAMEPYSKYNVSTQLFTEKTHYNYSVTFELSLCRDTSNPSCSTVDTKYREPITEDWPVGLYHPRTWSLWYLLGKYNQKHLIRPTIDELLHGEPWAELTEPLPKGKVLIMGYILQIEIEEVFLNSVTERVF